MTKQRHCFVAQVGDAIEALASALDSERKPPFKGDILDLLEWATKDVLVMRQQLASAQADANTAWAQAHRLALELEWFDSEGNRLPPEPTPLQKAHGRIEELEQQLAEHGKQITQLRDALTKERDLRVFGQSVECGKIHWESIRDMRRDVYKGTEEALAATDDLSGYILCEREPRG